MDSLARSVIIQDGQSQECDSWAAAEIIRLREEVARITAERDAARAMLDPWREAAAECARERCARKELQQEIARLNQRILDDNKAYGCELRDPAGTIWDHAAQLQQEVARLTTLYNDTKTDLKLQEDANSGLWRVNEQRRRDNAELRAVQSKEALRLDELQAMQKAQAKLRAENAALLAGLRTIENCVPALNDGEFVTLHYDGDGNELGFERHDPVTLVHYMQEQARATIDAALAVEEKKQ